MKQFILLYLKAVALLAVICLTACLFVYVIGLGMNYALAVDYSGGSSLTSNPATDTTTGAATAIVYPHHQIHAGNAYHCRYHQAVSDDNYRTAISFTTSDTTTWCHMVMDVTTTDETTIYVYEGVTTDADEGTDLAIFNHDRNSSNTSTVLDNDAVPTAGNATSWTEAQLAAANLTTGTTAYTEILSLATGQGGKTVGGGTRGMQEFILRQNTKYMFMVQSTDADDNVHDISLHWYEHANL